MRVLPLLVSAAISLSAADRVTFLRDVAAFWLIGALVSGPVYGVLGSWWAAKRSRIAAFAIWGAFLLEPVAWLARLLHCFRRVLLFLYTMNVFSGNQTLCILSSFYLCLCCF